VRSTFWNISHISTSGAIQFSRKGLPNFTPKGEQFQEKNQKERNLDLKIELLHSTSARQEHKTQVNYSQKFNDKTVTSFEVFSLIQLHNKTLF